MMNDDSQRNRPKAEWVAAYNSVRDALENLEPEKLHVVSKQLHRAYDALRLTGTSFTFSVCFCFSLLSTKTTSILTIPQVLGVGLAFFLFFFGWFRLLTGIVKTLELADRLNPDGTQVADSLDKEVFGLSSLTFLQRTIVLASVAYLILIVILTWW